MDKPTFILPQTRTELRHQLALGNNRGIERPIHAIVADLSKPIPSGLISWKPVFSKGKQTSEVPYLAHSDVSQVLDFICPGWSKLIQFEQISTQLIVRCTLTILTETGAVYRDSLGSEDTEKENYGGCAFEAEAQAFRRAAANFGLGRYLYDGKIVEAMQKRRR